ncbi:MAG: T9SS type A sorting domain-containing protein [Saprospiraceae bacterium]|nr:T9SS type A sorting domain-containing protein [Saprospiraceae bacterium]
MEAQLGTTFCVDIQADNFEGIEAIQFAISWDSTILHYESFNIVKNSGSVTTYLPDQNAQNQFAIIGNELRMAWLNSYLAETTLLNRSTLFQVCFTPIQNHVNTSIRFSNQFIGEAVRTQGLTRIPVISGNGGTIKVGIPTVQTARLEIGDAQVEPAEYFCLPVKLEQVSALAGLQFGIVWDSNALDLDTLRLINDPLGLAQQPNSYNIIANEFKLAWFEPNTQNVVLPDSILLFELCYQVIADVGSETLVSFSSNPIFEAIQFADNGELNFLAIELKDGVVKIVNTENVLPGDTNLDVEVSHLDLINIGLGYGQTGPMRTNASLDFVPQYAANWTNSTPTTLINYKHADANGDGIINDMDTKAIELNWVNQVTIPADSISSSNAIPFYVAADTIRYQNVNEFPIILGSADIPAQGVYALAFSVYYKANEDINGIIEVDLDNSWLGTLGENIIAIQRFFPEERRVDVAISRIDQISKNGFGTIGNIRIVMEDVILFQKIKNIEFTIDHVRAIGINEEVIPTINNKTTSRLINLSGILDKALEEIRIYPNPTSNYLEVSSLTFNIEQFTLINTLGKVVLDKKGNAQLLVNELPKGIYFVEIQTNKGNFIQKVIIE